MGLVLKYKVPEGVAILELEYKPYINPPGGKIPFDAHPGVGRVRISGDVDEEAERSAIALGFKPHGIMKQVVLWEKHPADFLTSRKNLTAFAKALRQQGPAALGASLDDIRSLFGFAAETIVQGESDVEEDLIECGCTDVFFNILDTYFPEHRRCDFDPRAKLDWPQRAIFRFAGGAILAEDDQALDDADELVHHQELMTIDVIINECDRSVYGTHIECDANAVLKILDEYYEEWGLLVEGYFKDVELTEWVIAEKWNSDQPDKETQRALDHLEIPYEAVDLLEGMNELVEPMVPFPDDEGDYGIFIDGQLFGTWIDIDDALQFFLMSREVAERDAPSPVKRARVGLYRKNKVEWDWVIDWRSIHNWIKLELGVDV